MSTTRKLSGTCRVRLQQGLVAAGSTTVLAVAMITGSASAMAQEIASEKLAVLPSQVAADLLSAELKPFDPQQQKQAMQRLAGLTKTAKSSKDFSEMIAACELELATHQYLSNNQTFIRSLIAWGLSRRGESRLELSFEFDLVSNREQAESALQQAWEDFDRAIVEDKTHWKSYLNRGIVHAKRKNWAAAAEDFQRSIHLRPGQTFAYFNLAEVEFQRGNLEASLQNYDKILEAAADDVQAINGRALVLAKSGKYAAAIAAYDRLSEMHPDDPWVLTNRADALQAAGRWKEAQDQYIAALQIQQAAAIYRRLAWLFATCPKPELQQPDGALTLAKKSISQTLKTTAAQWDTLAAAQAAGGDFSAAIDSMNQALVLEPDNQDLQARQQLYLKHETFVQTVKVPPAETDGLSR